MAKDLKGELTTRALLAAGKDAAKRAIEDFTLTDEEKAARDAERALEAKRRRWKWIAIAVGSLILMLAIVFLIAKIWMWVLGLALVAAAGVAIYYFAQRKWRAMREPVVKVLPKELPKTQAERRVSEPPPVIDHDAREKQIDAELAALKAKTRR
jgi:hypothetical protein